MGMEKLPDKWPILDTQTGKMENMDITMFFKYLGVNIDLAPWKLYSHYNEQVIRTARNYMYSVMSLAKTGPDTSQLAHSLWTCCAVPAFLYGVECNVLLQSTINKLESFQFCFKELKSQGK